MNKSSVINEIIKRHHENKLAHAFLLETNDKESCFKDAIELVKNIVCPFNYASECNEECNLCNLIDNNVLPSLIIISPEGQVIKKDQISDMMEKFDTKPVFTKYNIYIVRDAERFNSYSANALLKFLEEPEDNIIGIFITSNKENVISTIRSRCQIFSCNYDIDINDKLDETILIDVKLYLNNIFKNKDDLLYNKTHMIGLYTERGDWEIFFNTMLYYLKDCYSSSRIDAIDLVKNVSKDNLVKMIVCIENIIKYINGNGNIDLILDKFVIEMRNYYE